MFCFILFFFGLAFSKMFQTLLAKLIRYQTHLGKSSVMRLKRLMSHEDFEFQIKLLTVQTFCLYVSKAGVLGKYSKPLYYSG